MKLKNDPAQEAIDLTNGPRQKNYGEPIDNWSDTATIWSIILKNKLKAPIEPEEAALCMIGVKLAREAHMPKHDNRVDMCGYPRVMESIIEAKEEMKERTTEEFLVMIQNEKTKEIVIENEEIVNSGDGTNPYEKTQLFPLVSELEDEPIRKKGKERGYAPQAQIDAMG